MWYATIDGVRRSVTPLRLLVNSDGLDLHTVQTDGGGTFAVFNDDNLSQNAVAKPSVPRRTQFSLRHRQRLSQHPVLALEFE